MMRRAWPIVCAAALAVGASSCSAVRCQWRHPNLQSTAVSAQPILPKRLAIVGWPPPTSADAPAEPGESQNPRVGEVLARVAADFIKLRRNYLVYDTSAVQKSFVEGCRGKVEGVLMVRALQVSRPGPDKVAMVLSVDMHRCRDGALVWRVEGAAEAPSHASELAELTDSYASALGEPARPFVAPAFTLLQDLFDGLPDVSLSDEEIEEKIELGMGPTPAERMWAQAQGL